ncbi:MAG TPA: hemerythrin domain-containing protein [Myxococcaceae bacterium]|nr:hemerythrin domain-containing protein [Myxococcaceae bacterium]
MNAIQLLKHQHQEVEKLFKEIERCEDDDRDELRRLFAELADNLAAHADIEEELFYPEVKQRQQDGMVQHAVEEHFEMKQFLAQLLDLEVGSSQFLMTLAQLKDAVLGHVEEEEGEMLPAARKLFSKAELDQLGQEMASRFEELIGAEPRFEIRDQVEAPAQV